jgi:hypothetical protein
MDRARARAGATRPWRAALLATAIATTAACAVPAAPALAAGGTVTVLPDTSALELSAYPSSTPLDVEVLRHGVRMATATVTTDDAGDASVNGGTTNCWTDATPDLLPGDVVRVTGGGFEDTKAVDAVTNTRVEQTAPDTVVVRGTAIDDNGDPLPLSGLEARIIGSSADRFANGRRDLRAGAGNPFPLTQDADDPTAWTATFPGLTPADVTKALHAVDVRGIFTDGADPNQTISESPVARAPAAPCTTPLRRDAITQASRSAVNAENAGDDLEISGVSQDAADVAVTLDDDDRTTPPITVPADLSASSGAQSFTATIAGEDLRGLSDGMLTASATYTVDGIPISGATLTILKDTVAPPAPVATPGAGTYGAPQSVTLDDDDATTAIHWTAGRIAPTAGSPVYGAPIAVTASQTIRAIAVDRAGNVSPSAAFAFVIAPPKPVTVDRVVQAPAAAALLPAAPVAAVAGTTAVSLPRVRSLTLPARISATRLRAQGLRLALRVPADAVVVRVAVRRADRHGRATGAPVATAVRLAPGADAVMRMRLHDRAFVRRLRRGRYVVEVAVGRTRTLLGPAVSRPLTVTR